MGRILKPLRARALLLNAPLSVQERPAHTLTAKPSSTDVAFLPAEAMAKAGAKAGAYGDEDEVALSNQKLKLSFNSHFCSPQIHSAMKIYSALFCFVIPALSASAQMDARLFRDPDVSATQITFVYGGDIWLAPKSGGTAFKIT